MSLRLEICRDDDGTWSVHGLSPRPVMDFPSLSASLDYARRQCGAAPATIELRIDGFYAVVHQENGWPQRITAPQESRPRRISSKTGLRARPVAVNYSDATSVARSRSRSSWFINWRASAMRLMAALASGFVAMKPSKSALRSTSSRQ